MSQNLYEKLMGKYESCPDDPMAKFAKVVSYVIPFYFIMTQRRFSVSKIYFHGQAPEGEYSTYCILISLSMMLLWHPLFLETGEVKDNIYQKIGRLRYIGINSSY